jgi:hypothetical protein
MKSKYICFVTPKSYELIKSKIPEKFSDIEIIATPDIYMNLFDSSWNEERCDNTAYIVERSHFEFNKVGFNF